MGSPHRSAARLASLVCLMTLGATSVRAQLEPQPTQFDKEQEAKKKRAPPKLTKPPELLEAVDPIYPPRAQQEGRSADVVMLIAIDKEGKVSRVDVTRSGGEDFDWAAMGAVTNFFFSPAEWDGKPGPVAIEYKQVFKVDIVVEEVPTEQTEAVEQQLDAIAAGEQGPINFEGIVREAGSKSALSDVEVSVEIELPIPEGVDTTAEDFEEPLDVRVTYTDDEGRFAFRDIPEGRHRVTLALTGYESSFIYENFSKKERTQAIVFLTPINTNAFETVVRERRARKEVAKIQLTREEVNRVPGTFGDPLRVIENLPGLARAPFIGGALIVRGANPDDTGVYYDGVEIPILYHFGGLKSIVNPEFLEDISFYPGGFGAYYGRATAGIVDVRSRDLKMKEFRGSTDISVVDTSFFFGGPIDIEGLPKFTIAAAARRSYIDALIPLAMEIFVPQSSGVVAAPVYWDYQLKIETKPLPGQTFSLFAFGSDDDLKVIGTTGSDDDFNLGFKTTFHRLVGRWTSRFPGGVTHFVQPFVGLDTADIGFGSEGLGIEADIDSLQSQWGVRDELRFKPSDMFEVAAGADYVGQTFGFNLSLPIPVEIGSFPRVYARLPPENQHFGAGGVVHQTAGYVEAIVQPFWWLKIVPSLRAELNYVLIEAEEKPDGTITDDTVVTLFNVDPRITARLSVLHGTTLKGAFGVYRQLPGGGNFFPETGNPYLDQPRALQFIAGVEQTLTDDINIDLQLYYTSRDLLPQSTGEVIIKGGGDVEPVNLTNGGLGRTFGAEVLLRHEISKYFYGWIAYTLSRSEIDTADWRDSYILTTFDQTHILTIVGSLNIFWGITLGGRFRLVSGNPTTIPNGSIHDLDTTSYIQLRQPTRAARLPYFHQLDLRIDRKWVFDNFSFTPYLDLLNAYNAPNAEGYQDDYRSRTREPIPSLPILPNFGLRGEF